VIGFSFSEKSSLLHLSQRAREATSKPDMLGENGGGGNQESAFLACSYQNITISNR